MRWIVDCGDDCGIEALDTVTRKLVALNDSGLARVEPERTCTRGDEFWECSECGLHGLHDEWRFCPNCGAKVVE